MHELNKKHILRNICFHLCINIRKEVVPRCFAILQGVSNNLHNLISYFTEHDNLFIVRVLSRSEWLCKLLYKENLTIQSYSLILL